MRKIDNEEEPLGKYTSVLSSLFTEEVELRMVDYLLDHSGHGFTRSHIARAINSITRYVEKYVKKLEEKNIVTTVGDPQIYLVSFNTDSEIGSALKQCHDQLKTVIQNKKEDKNEKTG